MKEKVVENLNFFMASRSFIFSFSMNTVSMFHDLISVILFAWTQVS